MRLYGCFAKLALTRTKLKKLEKLFLQASQKGHLEIVRFLGEAGADRIKADKAGTTPLRVASRNGRLEIVRLLCKAGADKDKASDIGTTPHLEWYNIRTQV